MKKRVVFTMMLIALCAAAFAQTPAGWAFTGENEPLLEGTIWVDVDPVLAQLDTTITYEFRFGGKFIRRFRDTSERRMETLSRTGIWQREGNNLKLLYDGYTKPTEGRYYPQTQRIMLSNDSTLELQQGSSIAPAAPVQSAQPAPAQSGSSSSGASSSSSSSSSSSRPAAPTLQNGRYAWANSGSNMTMTLSNPGFINAYVGNSVISIWQGTYRISGNQLVITVSNPTSEYSFLRGTTYTYTITSDTSFQGNGETWVRTGSF
jgi:hypothetical protein